MASDIIRGFVEIRKAPQPMQSQKIVKKENTPAKIKFKRIKPPPKPKIKKFEAQKSMMMEFFKIPLKEKTKETQIVREKGGTPSPSSTPCQDTGKKLSTSPVVGCNLRTILIEIEKGGPAPPPSTGWSSSTPPPDGGDIKVQNSRTTPTETPPSPPPGPDRIETLPAT